MSITAIVTVPIFISIPILSPSLKLVFKRTERGRATNALKLALDVVVQVVISSSIRASAAAGGSAVLVV
jgi:hypothetical protein